ncbi:hypothetical protein BH09BAC1_BH09BAC1_10010 [soil metagenome]
MKKVIILSALAFGLLLSFTAPLAAQTKGAYMNLCIMYKGIKSTMYVIHPDGTNEEVRMKSIANGFGVSFDKIANIQSDILTKLNELRGQGWAVDQVTTISNEGFIVTTYLLKKE